MLVTGASGLIHTTIKHVPASYHSSSSSNHGGDKHGAAHSGSQHSANQAGHSAHGAHHNSHYGEHSDKDYSNKNSEVRQSLMMTSGHGNAVRNTTHCEEIPPINGRFHSKDAKIDVFFFVGVKKVIGHAF